MAKNDNDIPDQDMNTQEDENVNNGNTNEDSTQGTGNTPSSDTETNTSNNDQSDQETQGKDTSPEQRIAQLEEEILSLKDKLLRKQADYENFRKRLYREKEDSVKYANQMVLLDIASVIDDFERAIKSAEEAKDFDAFHDGIVLIEKRLISTLEKKWELKRFDSVGEAFNPERHLAIAVEDSADYDVPTVIEDYQRGYLFHERVLRPAKVKVAQPIADKENKSDNNNQESDNDQE